MANTLGDRRSARRYRLEMPLRYRILRQDHSTASGVGLTTDMSSGGMAVASDAELPNGSLFEAWITWPAVSEEAACVELHVAGRVIRSSGRDAAIQMKRHDFVVYRKEANSGADGAA
jgi:hypothetical protein